MHRLSGGVQLGQVKCGNRFVKAPAMKPASRGKGKILIEKVETQHVLLPCCGPFSGPVAGGARRKGVSFPCQVFAMRQAGGVILLWSKYLIHGSMPAE